MSTDRRAATACPNCGADLAAGQAFCGACGQARVPPRLTLHEIGHDLLHALVHVDRSALALVRQLLLRPGTVARDYVAGRRRRYFGPFAFLVVVVALGSAVIALSGFHVVTTDAPNAVAQFLQAHVNLLYFVQVPVLAACCRALCAREGFNYAEHLVLAAYTGAMHVLYATFVMVPVWWLLAPGERLARALYFANYPVWPLYFGFAASQFLPGRRWVSAVQGAAAVLLAQFLVQGAVTLATALLLPAG